MRWPWVVVGLAVQSACDEPAPPVDRGVAVFGRCPSLLGRGLVEELKSRDPERLVQLRKEMGAADDFAVASRFALEVSDRYGPAIAARPGDQERMGNMTWDDPGAHARIAVAVKGFAHKGLPVSEVCRYLIEHARQPDDPFGSGEGLEFASRILESHHPR